MGNFRFLKSLSALLIVGVIVLGASACHKDGVSDGDTPATTTAAVTTTTIADKTTGETAPTAADEPTEGDTRPTGNTDTPILPNGDTDTPILPIGDTEGDTTVAPTSAVTQPTTAADPTVPTLGSPENPIELPLVPVH